VGQKPMPSGPSRKHPGSSERDSRVLPHSPSAALVCEDLRRRLVAVTVDTPVSGLGFNRSPSPDALGDLNRTEWQT
jgi:hypothetical protein